MTTPNHSRDSFGVANLCRGELIDSLEADDDQHQLEELAMVAAELFATDRISWELIFGHLASGGEASGLHDILIISPRTVHLAQRVPDATELALIGVAQRSRPFGAIVSEARRRASGVATLHATLHSETHAVHPTAPKQTQGA